MLKKVRNFKGKGQSSNLRIKAKVWNLSNFNLKIGETLFEKGH